MVEYTLVLEIGQSNAAPVGDIQGWEDKHPQLAIRSPNTARSEVKQFSTGSYRDDFTLAATFKGGPQVGDVGTEMGAAINGQWQSANLRGVAVDAVRVATFYNPVATLQTTAGHARSWPGTYNVVPTTNALTPNTAREFSTNFIVQAGREERVAASISGATITSTGTATFAVNDIVVFSAGYASLGLANRGPFKVTAVDGEDFDIQTWPEGAAVDLTVTGQTVSVWKVNNTAAPFLITRKRTGSTHTYAPTGLGNGGGARLVVDPPFTPAQSDEEEFTVPMSLQRDAGSTGNPLVFDAFLGGFVNNNPALTATADVRTSTSGGYRMLHSPVKPLRQGRGVDTENSSWPGATSVIVTTASTTVTALPTADDYTAFISVGDPLLLSDATGGLGLPPGFSVGVPFYVTAITSGTVALADSYGGTPIPVTTGSTPWGIIMLPSTEVRYPTRQPVALVPPANTATQLINDVLTVAVEQEFAAGEKVRVSYASGVGPTNLTAGDYYVTAIVSSGGAEKLDLSIGPATTALDFTWAGQSPIIERLDAYTTWFVSADRGGADITTGHLSPTVDWTERQRFAGSLTGLRLRCVSGANVGQWKHGKHITRDSTSTLTQVHYDGDWATAPLKNDIFVVEPTPVGDQERPFRKFCQLLPWAPFEGLARGSREAGPASVTVTSGAAARIVVLGMFAPDRTSVRFYTTGTLPNGLTPGKTYYSALAVGNAFTIAATYGGAELQQTTATSGGLHYAETVDNDNGFNPHPPGFNYPSQFAMPRRYMPFDGYVAGSFYGEETAQEASGVTAGMQLSFDLYNYTGRRTLFVPLAFGNTSIAHREVHQAGDGRSPFGWHDPDQQISWAPGEDNGCFARLEDTLDGVKLALTEEGSTVKDVVVHFNQGEADATEEYTSTTYRQNLNRLKQAVRQALYDRGLSPIKAERIKWLHATINESLNVWPYAKTVNAAIEAEAQADPYSRSLVGTDLEVHAERDTFEGNPTADGLHYHGAEMDTLGKRAFVAYKALERSGYTEIDVCNLALANIGEQARVTSIDPSDGSREADLCAQFFALARDQMLEKHAWDFALRSVKPTARSASPRVDYKYAYDYPEDVVSVLAVVRSDVDYNYKTMGSTGQQPYSVELDSNGNRMLLTDQKNALLLYVAKVDDATMWSSSFTRALSWQLASHLAGPVMKGEEGMKAVQMCEAMAERTLRQAAKHDGDHKRDVDINDHVPTWQRHRSNRGFRS